MQVEANKPAVIVDLAEYLNLRKIRDEFESSNKETPAKATEVGTPKEYEFHNMRYLALDESKIKVKGILDKFLAHPKIGPALKIAITKDEYESIGEAWLPVQIYQCLYSNPDGMIWVRMKEEFDNKFKQVP